MAVTFDPAHKSSRITLSNGNLTATEDGTGNPQAVRITDQKTSGKWYAEFTMTTSSQGVRLGIVDPSQSMTASLSGADAYSYNSSGTKSHTVDNEAYGASYAAGDTIGVAMDLDAAQITFYKNNVSQGVAYTGITTASGWMFAYSDNNGTGGATAVTINNGATAFTFTPPAGFAGMDSPPPASHGNGAVTLEKFTATGSRLAAGAVTLQKFTAVGGHNGLGTCTMLGLTVAGGGGPLPFGAVTLEDFTAGATGHSASGSLSTMQPLTASGTGFVSSVLTHQGEIPVLTMSANGLTGILSSLDKPLPLLQLEAIATGSLLTLPMFTADGFLLSGNVLSGADTLPKFTLSAAADLNVPAALAGILSHLKLTASGFDEALGTLVLDLPKMYLTATGLSGSALSVDEALPLITLTAVGYGPYVGDAALSFKLPQLTAEAISTLAATIRTWVVNARKKGLTEYTNFAFNSYAEFRDQVLAVGDGGMFKLTATDKDVTTNIDATVRTGAETFGTSYNKRVPRIYAGYAATGDLYFATYTSQDGKRLYLLPWNNITGVQQRRVPVGRGPKSPYWQFEVSNVEGADFLLEHVQVYPEKTTRRVI